MLCVCLFFWNVGLFCDGGGYLDIGSDGIIEFDDGLMGSFFGLLVDFLFVFDGDECGGVVGCVELEYG